MLRIGFFSRRFRATLTRRYRELMARLMKRAFYCRALSGQSDDSVIINSNFTVSCNGRDCCQSNVLGSLHETGIEAIFGGERAMALRKALASGRLPTDSCALCNELCEATREQANQHITGFAFPKGVMLENTTRCNLDCVACLGRKVDKSRTQRSLTLSQIEAVAQSLNKVGVKKISYFDWGEPFLPGTVLQEVSLLKRNIVDLRLYVCTNGTFAESEDRMEAALLFDDILVSLNGVNTPMVQKHQRGHDFERGYQSMQRLVRLRTERGLERPTIGWRYVLFWWNDHPQYIEKAIEMARQAGIEYVVFSGTVTPVWGLSFRHHFLKHLRGIGRPVNNGRSVIVSLNQ